MMKKNLLLIALLFITFSVSAQKNYWKQVSANDVVDFTKGKPLFPGSFKPAVYKLFSLDEEKFAALLTQSPHEKNIAARQSNFIVAIPVANGQIEKFRITESPVF